MANKKRRREGLSKFNKAEIEMDLAWKVVDENTLPKGLVKKLLEKNNVDTKTIKRIITPLVPYMHSDD